MQRPLKSQYLHLLKKTLTHSTHINTHEYYPLTIEKPNTKTAILFFLDKLLRKRNFAISTLKFVSEENRLNGYDWPSNADTMIGINRLTNIESCIYSIVEDKIEGDLIEAGVWRGGATIFMRAVLKELNVTHKKVWVADSFQGLPRPHPDYPADRNNKLYSEKIFKVSLEDVRKNFAKYDLLDEQVEFLSGWFKNSLAAAPVQQLSLVRLDCDMYESTIQSFTTLYPKLSAGGYLIIDDYNAFEECRKAVNDYRNQHTINIPIIEIDKQAIYWRKA
jgi:O-methyltransferase